MQKSLRIISYSVRRGNSILFTAAALVVPCPIRNDALISNSGHDSTSIFPLLFPVYI